MPPCRFCAQKQLDSEQTGQYTVDALLPPNFNPFDQQGVRPRQCTEHEKIVNSHDCSRYMECLNGEWFNLACPTGYSFNPSTRDCQAGSGSCAGVKPSGDYTSIYLLPLYNRSDASSVATAFSNAANAPPAQIPRDLRESYV